MSYGLRCVVLAALLLVGRHSPSNRSPLPANIGLRLIGPSLLVVPVSVNGQGPFDFVIDTGTNTTLVDPALAKDLGLAPEGSETLRTLTGPSLVPRYHLSMVAAGTAVLRDVPALAQPMTVVQRLDAGARGILGLGVLSRFSFSLDYANRRMRLYDADRPLQVRGGTRVAARIVHDRLLLTVASAAAPRGSWNLALDSGISQILLFADRIVSADQIADPAGRASVRLATNRSSSLGQAIRLDSLTIGGLQLEQLPALVLSPDGSTADSAEDGLLPASLFRSILFDRATSTVVLDSD